MSVRFLVCLFACFSFAVSGYAQNMVKGKVTDENGNPLAGVSVIVKNTTRGVASDLDGNYSIQAAPSETLEFSFLSMFTEEREVGNQSVINVIMREDRTNLQEVVVVGYGQQKKIHLTGSVASVDSEEILKSTVSDMSQSLVGKLPGIISQQATGAPGADGATLLVRGYSSYNGSSPLVLVDGVKRTLGFVNPHDVASVTVLKDAASCAVYGMDAGAGVILITTKSGSEGKAQVNYSGSVTFSNATAIPKMMNGTQYMQYYNMARVLDGDDPYFSEEQIAMTSNGDPSDGLENTDWTAPLYKTTTMHQHSLSVQGGTDKVRYFVSGNYVSQNGIIKGHNYQRGGFRSNIQANPFRNLTLNMNVGAYVVDSYTPGSYSYTNQESYNIFHQLLYSLPFVPQELDGMPVSGYRTNSNAANPIYGSANSGFQEAKRTILETSASLTYELPWVKGLKVGMFFSWDFEMRNGRTFSYAYELLAPDSFGSTSYSKVMSANLTADGNMYVSANKINQIVLRPSVSYERDFGKHSLNALFLYEQQTGNSWQITGGRRDFALFDLPYLTFGDAGTATNSDSAGVSAQAGYVGRVSYAYADKYLVELSARYDGSYLFHKDNRWGFFPSASLGWVVSEENFFKDALPEVELFKLRASVGELGSKNLSSWLYRKSYSWQGNAVAFGNPPTAQNVLSNAVSYPMESLTWERIRSYDVGFEFSGWNAKLALEFDWFYKYTYNILTSIGSSVFPPSLGGHYPDRVNSGSFDNRGFDLKISHRNRVGSFNYGITGNLSYAHNRVLSRAQSDNILPWQSTLGYPVNSIWGYKSDGLYQSQEEIDAAPKPVNVTPRVGDIKYVDINGDGQITADDQTYIARGAMPELIYSLQLDGDWKGLDFSIQFQGAALTDKMLMGAWTNYSGAVDLTPLTVPWYANYDNAPLYLVEGSWRPDNTDAEYPRLSIDKASYTNNAVQSDFWKRNGAYLRLKNVTIGYTFPEKWMRRINVDQLRIYVSGYNLWTLTEFKYIDPESANVITGYYPQQRTVSVGLNLTF